MIGVKAAGPTWSPSMKSAISRISHGSSRMVRNSSGNSAGRLCMSEPKHDGLPRSPLLSAMFTVVNASRPGRLGKLSYQPYMQSETQTCPPALDEAPWSARRRSAAWLSDMDKARLHADKARKRVACAWGSRVVAPHPAGRRSACHLKAPGSAQEH